jgi:hypothetical protein
VTRRACVVMSLAALLTIPSAADTFFFSTGNPDGLIATLSRVASSGKIETETADDFIVPGPTRITQATFIGLLPTGTPLSSVTKVEIELYHVFPTDSANPPSGNVPTRVNSPADVEISAATRDSSAGSLTFTVSILNSSFAVANTVVNGINKSPNQFTGGEGAATGEEVLISVNFTTPIDLPADHYFFRPEVLVSTGDFLWLSAPKPIVAPGTPFSGDLQSWIRNANLAPDWLRIGTDITHQGPFNAAFSLSGFTFAAFQTRYSSNLSSGDSVINITNTGESSTAAFPTQNGNICANVYTFSPDEQLISCCSCLVTPDGLQSLSARNDLISNTLTPGVPTSIVIKLLASAGGATQSSCNASTVGTGTNVLAPGMAAWGTTIHALPVTPGSPATTYGETETAFTNATLSEAEARRITTLCGFIQTNGSGFGVCRSCRFGGLGAVEQ